jgi:hypothetical protein
VCPVVEITCGGDGAVGADPGLQIADGGDAARGLHRGRQVHRSVGSADCSFQIFACQRGVGKHGLAESFPASVALRAGRGDRVSGEPCRLHRAAQITECLRVLTRKIGIVDKPCPFRFRASINVLEGVFGLDHRMCGLLDFAKRGVGTSLQR